MTAHWQGSDQRLYGENFDVLSARCVWNVGQFANTDVFWPRVTLFKAHTMFQLNKRYALLCARRRLKFSILKNIWKHVTLNRLKVNHKSLHLTVLSLLTVSTCYFFRDLSVRRVKRACKERRVLRWVTDLLASTEVLKVVVGCQLIITEILSNTEIEI